MVNMRRQQRPSTGKDKFRKEDGAPPIINISSSSETKLDVGGRLVAFRDKDQRGSILLNTMHLHLKTAENWEPGTDFFVYLVAMVRLRNQLTVISSRGKMAH